LIFGGFILLLIAPPPALLPSKTLILLLLQGQTNNGLIAMIGRREIESFKELALGAGL